MSIHSQILAELNLKVGNTVKITHSVPNQNLGWAAHWNKGSMDKCIGKQAIVKGLSDESGVCVEFDGYEWHFPAQVIEVVDRSVKAEYIDVKISDSYTAKVYPGKRIEVGCQTITPEILEQINIAFKK